MSTEYSWAEDEFIRSNLALRKIPGILPRKVYVFRIIYIVIALISIFFIYRYGSYLFQSDYDLSDMTLWFLENGTCLFICLMYFCLFLLSVYWVFFASKKQIKRELRNNRTLLLGKKSFCLEDNKLQVCTVEDKSEWTLGPSFTFWFLQETVCLTVEGDGKNRRPLWALPRRVFDSAEEEKIFRELCGKYCKTEDLTGRR